MPPPAMPDEVRRDRISAVGSEDSLLSHAELTAEEALTLLLQGTASVRLSAFANPFLYCFSFVN